jgi:L-amino acid N-acyltransferase YncA
MGRIVPAGGFPLIYFKPMTETHEWDWMVKRTLIKRYEDTQGVVAFNAEGVIKGIFAFDSFTPDACQIHFALDSAMPIRHGFFNEIARHLFIQCGCRRVFGRVRSDNRRSSKLAERVGFTEVARIPNGYKEGVDQVVLCMEKEGCRWLDTPRNSPQQIEEAA